MVFFFLAIWASTLLSPIEDIGARHDELCGEELAHLVLWQAGLVRDRPHRACQRSTATAVEELLDGLPYAAVVGDRRSRAAHISLPVRSSVGSSRISKRARSAPPTSVSSGTASATRSGVAGPRPIRKSRIFEVIGPVMSSLSERPQRMPLNRRERQCRPDRRDAVGREQVLRLQPRRVKHELALLRVRGLVDDAAEERPQKSRARRVTVPLL